MSQPTDGQIAVSGLSKQFMGGVRAVDNLSFTVEPGSVTGFLGPNGAGKTTTLRCLLGLVSPSAGTATIGGRRYRQLHNPLRIVGACLEASSFYPGRTARNHLKVYAAHAGIPRRRVGEVLELVDLEHAARRRVKGFSLGMRQRLALATALLGDPRVLILDEPTNGLDPEGIRWLRGLLRHLAEEGRTILVSSHLLAEVQQTVDRVVILTHGRLVQQGTVSELAAGYGVTSIVRTPQIEQLRAALQQTGARFEPITADGLRVFDLETPELGHLAFTNGCEVHEMRQEEVDLEQIFFRLTGEHAAEAPPPQPMMAPPGFPPPPPHQQQWAPPQQQATPQQPPQQQPYQQQPSQQQPQQPYQQNPYDGGQR